MLAVVKSAASFGIQAAPILVEVDIAQGLPGFAMVGLPENTVKEARVRVQAAIGNSGFLFPMGKITVNLAPAHVRKEGTGFDFPMAMAMMAAQGVIPMEKLQDTFFFGELSLSGEIKSVRGAISVAEVALDLGAKRIMVAPENGAEAALVEGIEVRAVKTFKDAVEFLLQGDDSKAPVVVRRPQVPNPEDLLDLSDVRGQHQARRALEIAAAGGHNILFVGGPGSGKTMMARRLPGILPELSAKEALEVTRIHSAAGLTLGGSLVSQRPFRAPHHSTTRAGMVGGGSGIPRPGELSLAMKGVLFLDELPEFSRHVLEVLRQPLESGEVILSRANGTIRYPAEFMLVAAMNPCPCGNFGTAKRVCRCGPNDMYRYRAKLSAPLLDRIDIHIEVPPVDLMSLQSSKDGEASKSVRERVAKARARQRLRLQSGALNATMDRKAIVQWATPSAAGSNLLANAIDRMGLSARAHDRILRVARTIADLEESTQIDVPHVAEAVQYRSCDRLAMAA